MSGGRDEARQLEARSCSGRAAFSDELEEWLRGKGPRTLGALEEVFAEKSFAVAVFLLMFVPALPLPTGGVTHVFEVMTVILGAEMALGRRTIWLPDRWRRRELGSLTTEKALPFVVRRIRQVERFSHPRGSRLIGHPLTTRLLGVVLIAFATGAAFAPPFSGLDTLPALGAVGVALAIVLDDIVVLGVSIAVGLGGIVLIAAVGAAVVHLLRRLI